MTKKSTPPGVAGNVGRAYTPMRQWNSAVRLVASPTSAVLAARQRHTSPAQPMGRRRFQRRLFPISTGADAKTQNRSAIGRIPRWSTDAQPSAQAAPHQLAPSSRGGH